MTPSSTESRAHRPCAAISASHAYRSRAARLAAGLGALLLRLFCAPAVLGAGPVGPAPGDAAVSAGENGWKLSVTPYLWTTDVGADVELEDREIYDSTIAFTDLLEDIETVFQLRAEAQRGAHGITFDLFDVTLSEEESILALPPEAGSQAILDSEIGMTILEVGGLYDPHGDQQGFALLYGTRILAQRVEIGGRFELFPERTLTASHEAEETLVDGLLGARYVKRFSRHWSWHVRGDLSAGATELTWSAESGLEYTFGKDGRYTFMGGYRQMVVDFEDEGALDVEMTLDGFLGGFRVAF